MSKNLKKSENLKKSRKISKNHFFFLRKSENFEKKIFVAKKKEKKCYPLSFPILGILSLTRALQSRPFQNPGGVPWAWHSRSRTGPLLPTVHFSAVHLCIAVLQAAAIYLSWFVQPCMQGLKRNVKRLTLQNEDETDETGGGFEALHGEY